MDECRFESESEQEFMPDSSFIFKKSPQCMKHNTRYIDNFNLEDFESIKIIQEENKSLSCKKEQLNKFKLEFESGTVEFPTEKKNKVKAKEFPQNLDKLFGSIGNDFNPPCTLNTCETPRQLNMSIFSNTPINNDLSLNYKKTWLVIPPGSHK